MQSSVADPTAATAPPPVPFDHRTHAPAGFWVRTAAHVIDSIILSAVITPLLIAFLFPEFMELVAQAQQNPALADPFGATKLLHSPIGLFIQYGIPTIAVLILWKWRSATPGKMIFGLKIVDAKTYGKPSTTCLFIRYFSYLASMVPFCLGFFWIGWDPRKQGWHDKLANTLVISTKS